MAINITTQSLFPVRRDKQIPMTVGVAGSSGSSIITNSSGGSVDLTGYITESSLNIGVLPTTADFFWNAGNLKVNFPTSLSGFINETSVGSHFKWISGLLNVSDYISKTQVDASLNNTWNITSYVNTSSYYDGSLNIRLKDTSLNMTKFKWVSGLLEPSVGTGTGDVTKLYVDGSLARRDTRLNNIDTSLNNTIDASGIQGIQGTQGSIGTQGTIGIQGVQGRIGTQGTIGVQGTIGAQGISGIQGLSGIQGAVGIQGTQGVQGRIGIQGTQGTIGTFNVDSSVHLYTIDPSIAWVNAKASGDITMTNANTWYNGRSLSVPAGTWLVTGTITMGRTNTTAIRYSAKITNGTTNYASAQQYAPSVNPHYISISLSTVITLSSTTTIYISGRATTGSCVIKGAIVDGASGNNATQLSAIKLNP